MVLIFGGSKWLRDCSFWTFDPLFFLSHLRLRPRSIFWSPFFSYFIPPGHCAPLMTIFTCLSETPTSTLSARSFGLPCSLVLMTESKEWIICSFDISIYFVVCVLEKSPDFQQELRLVASFLLVAKLVAPETHHQHVVLGNTQKGNKKFSQKTLVEP